MVKKDYEGSCHSSPNLKPFTAAIKSKYDYDSVNIVKGSVRETNVLFNKTFQLRFSYNVSINLRLMLKQDSLTTLSHMASLSLIPLRIVSRPRPLL